MVGTDDNSSVLFPRILESRLVGLDVLNSKYHVKVGGQAKESTLYEYFQAADVDGALLGLSMLRAFDVDKETGLVTVSVTTEDPTLSAQVANRFVDALEQVNSDIRKQTATQNASFVSHELIETRRELSAAEERLAQFKQQNMRIVSPELELQQGRLERDVQLKSQIFITLANQEQLARVDEAKNLPIVRILDRAAEPTAPVPVPRVALLAAGLIVGTVLAGLAVAGVEFGQHLRDQLASL
jgi:uncharacterized protein involved in exopolysaccharide biosynthesis